MISWRLAFPLVVLLFLLAVCVGRTHSDNQWDSPTYSNCTSGSCQSTGVVEHTSGYTEYDVGYDTAFCYQ